MNSNVHPVVVLLVLVFTGIAVAVWMWGTNEAASIGGPAELKLDHRGHVYLQVQNSLIEHDVDGRYVATHDLEALGVELFLGSFDFFSNGDILLRLGPDPRSFGDNLRAFQRKTNQASLAPESPESGLYRCNLAERRCTPFANGSIDFKAAFGVFIDRESDTVYITDTTRHLLRVYSAAGDALQEPLGGFQFPNQLSVHDDKLLVADTNHHGILALELSERRIGEAIALHSVTPDVATAAGQIWPAHFVRVGDTWWVNNMRTGMNEGGLYVFDVAWQFVKVLELPSDADPIALAVIKDEVWVSDWNNDSVRRFSTNGDVLADLDSTGLMQIVSQSIDARRNYELTGYAGVLMLILVLGGLLVRGFAVGMSAPAENA